MTDASTSTPTLVGSTRGPGARPADHPGRGRKAAQRVREREHLQLSLPGVGSVDLPHPQQLAYLGGLGLLAALEIIDWPAALVLAVGHALVTQQHSRTLEELGEALDDA